MKSFSPEAIKAARSIANYCLTRFPCDTPPHEMLDVPWFAEKVQKAIDEAMIVNQDRHQDPAIAPQDPVL